jgi:hypothetical protein
MTTKPSPFSKIINEPRLGFVKEHGSKRRPVKRKKGPTAD